MDDDNIARPHEIGTFVRAALNSGADILTTFIDFFKGELPPDPGQPPLCRWLFAGVESLAGIARNCFGDANALVRRVVFERLGGFTEDRGTTHEDWEFFARAVLHGCTLEVVPDALVWYRYAGNSMIRSTPTPRNYARSLRPYLEEVPAPYRDLFRLVQGQALANEYLRRFEQKPLRYRIADTIYRWINRMLLRRFDP
jgi:GT2 family glycosyltransferase